MCNPTTNRRGKVAGAECSCNPALPVSSAGPGDHGELDRRPGGALLDDGEDRQAAVPAALRADRQARDVTREVSSERAFLNGFCI